MAIKSIKLKLFFRKDQTQLYQHIWHTHKIFHDGVNYYLKQLLLLRQVATNGENPKKDELLRLARTAQATNGKSTVGTDEEILVLLRKLYEELIPAAIGKKSNAQQLSRAFLSILVDPKSKAGLGVAKKRKEPKPGEPTNNAVLVEAKKLGVLPLFPSFSDSLGNWIKRSVCTTWDRDMFQQTIERLCSWESWNIRVKNECQELENEIEVQAAALMPKPEWMGRLQQYEQERKIELDLVALASERPYRIAKSGIRGWKDLREHWQSLEVKSKDELCSIINDYQKELRGDFGDPDVFRWLAQPENHFIWDCEKDNLSQFVKLNEAIEKRERAKEQAQFTPPDPAHHPIWVRFDGPGGNLQWYTVQKTKDEFSLSLVALIEEAGSITERVITVPLAISTQFSRIQIQDFKTIPNEILTQIGAQKNDTKVQWVCWTDPGTRHKFIGKLGGAKIQFERKALEKEKLYCDAYINIAINYVPLVTDELSKCFTLVKPEETSPWTIVDFKPEAFNLGAWDKPTGLGIAGLHSGLRVMSVSLRLKTLAVCSVFEIQDHPESLAVPVMGTKWYAIHRRSFVLTLPGEQPNAEVLKKRAEIIRQRLELKSKLRKLSQFLSLAAKEKTEDRKEYLKTFVSEDFTDEKLLVSQIEKQLQEKQENWQAYILTVHRSLEHDLGREFEAWRKKYRRKSAELRNTCGLSLWWIQELSETRKLINSWCAHARLPREIVRARSLSGERKDKKAREVDLDARLLQHVNNLKEDRLKKGADAIVMAALGYVYTRKKRWVAKYKPCRVVLFRDISELRMDRALSRKSNAKLMAWAHRAIPKYVAHQGEIYSLLTGTVRISGLAHSHARNGAPAVRMLQVENDHLDQLWFARAFLLELAKRRLIQKKDRKAILALPRAERRAKLLEYTQVGRWIPWEDGEIIVTKIDGKAIKGNVLVNTTQLMQRLFWQRQLVITKLWCSGTADRGFAPIKIGKRAEEALGFGILVPKDDGYCWKSLTKKQFNALDKGDTRVEAIKVMFFRDASGEFAPADRWYPANDFWNRIEKSLDRELH